MLDGLRAEFPGATRWLARSRTPTVAREHLWWAFLSAAGGGSIVGGIVALMFIVLATLLLAPTEPNPDWLTLPNATRVAASLAIGAVAMRAGGIRALALYVTWELLLVLAQFPGRQFSCQRSGQFAGDLFNRACDLPGMVAERWLMWLCLGVGAVASRFVLRTRGDGTNALLRAAGAFAIVLTAATTLYGVLTYATIGSGQPYLSVVFTGVYVAGQVIGAICAAVVLRRAPLAASVLLAALILSALALRLPNVLANRIPNMPLELLFLQWSGVVAPVLAAATLLTIRLAFRPGRVPAP
ncbi:MAG TPA: hypothetical protein VM052_02485 [Candidatus Limnocylindrales bacterium]|nr:hypothetical protein [Candidatus Limnocylindrales bacterium]